MDACSLGRTTNISVTAHDPYPLRRGAHQRHRQPITLDDLDSSARERTALPARTARLTVLTGTDVRQRIDGFGASSAWRGSWSSGEADMFFSTNTGLGLSLAAQPRRPEGGLRKQHHADGPGPGARVWSAPWSPPTTFKDTECGRGAQCEWLGASSASAANYQAYASQLARYVVEHERTPGTG